MFLLLPERVLSEQKSPSIYGVIHRASMEVVTVVASYCSCTPFVYYPGTRPVVLLREDLLGDLREDLLGDLREDLRVDHTS